MTVQIAIIGLGQIGASMGLALAKKSDSIQRIGHDLEFGQARQAEKKGAVDKISFNLPNTVANADVVILALPADQVRPTLQIIAPELKESCVVMDTAPLKQAALQWAAELLPAERHYIGLTPVLNGHYLQDPASGLEAARGDLFQNGLLAIISPPSTPAAAIRLATDLASLLGAEHLFVDAAEVDSFMAAVHLLPQLAAAALADAVIHQPGWQDVRKLTGRSFAEETLPIAHLDDPAALAAAAVYTREHTLRAINKLIDSLVDLRIAIHESNTQDLTERLSRARNGRAEWIMERVRGNWSAGEMNSATDVPSSGDFIGRLFGMRPRKPNDKRKL